MTNGKELKSQKKTKAGTKSAKKNEERVVLRGDNVVPDEIATKRDNEKSTDDSEENPRDSGGERNLNSDDENQTSEGETPQDSEEEDWEDVSEELRPLSAEEMANMSQREILERNQKLGEQLANDRRLASKARCEALTIHKKNRSTEINRKKAIDEAAAARNAALHAGGGVMGPAHHQRTLCWKGFHRLWLA